MPRRSRKTKVTGRTVRCATCSASNPEGMRFCGQCAAALELASGPNESGPRLDTAERRQLTVLFCDLVGSTRHAANMDPESWRAVLQAYHALCDAVVRPLNGHVAQYLGDGVLVYFGYPRALEDAARRAVLAGLQLVSAVRRQAITVELPPALTVSVTLDVRIGIHTGAVVVDRLGSSDNAQQLAVGDVLNLASRIQSAAEPGWVVVSDATQRLTRGFFETQALAPQPLAGYAKPVVLHRISRETTARDRLDIANASPGGLTPFVGHAREVNCLYELWEQAKAGTGPVVRLLGEAGIGKSRHVQVLQAGLLHELQASLECRCLPYFQTTAMYPLLEMVERGLGLGAKVALNDKLARLEQAVGGSRALGAQAVPLLASLLSVPMEPRPTLPELSPPKLRQATFDLLATWIEEQAPLLFVVEDLHWADPSTLDFLVYFIQRAPVPGLMTVLTHRPDFDCIWQSPRLSELLIDRLPPEDAASVVRFVAGAALPQSLLPELLAKADGNPLFVEEVTRAVIEAVDAATPGASGIGALPPELIPSTMQDPLMARLDQLGPSKHLAQLAATLGREFSYRLLQAVSNTEDTALRADLQRLLDTGMVYRREHANEETYYFKHALIRDAAYASLLQRTRRSYHQRIADALSTQFPEVVESRPALPAQHYEAAGVAERAAELWGLAGQRAIAGSAFAEANAAYSHALEQLSRLPECRQRDDAEIELLIGRGLSLISTAGFSAPEVEETYTRARVLCERYGDAPLRVLYGIWVFQFVRGDVEATATLMRDFERVVRDGPDSSEALLAASCLVVRHFWWGDFERAARYAREAHEIIESRSDLRGHSRIMLRELGFEGPLYALVQLAWCELYAGRPSQCQAALARGVELAAQIEQPYTTAMIHAYACAIAHDLHEPETALAEAEQAIAIATEHGFPFWLAAGLFAKGWALCELDQEPAGLATLDAGLQLYRNMGVLVSMPYYASYAVEQHLRAGRHAQGLEEVSTLLELSQNNVGRGYMPELLRLKSALLSAQGDTAQAGLVAREALQAARLQATPLFELRAALALARLLADCDAGEAKDLLCRALARMPEDSFVLRELSEVRTLVATLDRQAKPTYGLGAYSD